MPCRKTRGNFCPAPCAGMLTQVGVVLSAHDMNWVSQVATHVVALTPEGPVCGERDAVLGAEVLERTFGCAWTQIGARWLPA